MTTLPTETKQVYVDGSVYYDAGHGIEIQVVYDKDILFTVPTSLDMEDPYGEAIATLVRAHATKLIRERLLGIAIMFKQSRWEIDCTIRDIEE